MDSQTSIGSLLASLRDLQAIYVRAKRLAALQQIYAGALPGGLSRSSRVAFERSGTVVVFADNGPVAAKLRHLAPRIVSEIVKIDPEVTAIRVEVQVTQGEIRRESRPHRIGSRGLLSLKALHDALPETALRAALGRLVASQGEHQALEHQEGDDDQP